MLNTKDKINKTVVILYHSHIELSLTINYYQNRFWHPSDFQTLAGYLCMTLNFLQEIDLEQSIEM